MVAEADSNGNAGYVYTPKAILITGGAGFIGSHVIRRLVKHHPEYKVLAAALSLQTYATACALPSVR